MVLSIHLYQELLLLKYYSMIGNSCVMYAVRMVGNVGGRYIWQCTQKLP